MNVRSIPWLAVAAAASLASASAFSAEAPPTPAQPTVGSVANNGYQPEHPTDSQLHAVRGNFG